MKMSQGWKGSVSPKSLRIWTCKNIFPARYSRVKVLINVEIKLPEIYRQRDDILTRWCQVKPLHVLNLPPNNKPRLDYHINFSHLRLSGLTAARGRRLEVLCLERDRGKSRLAEKLLKSVG